MTIRLSIRVYLFVVLILCFSSIGYAIDYGDKSALKTDVTITNVFTVAAISNSYAIDFVNATLSSYPRNDVRQLVSNIVTNPNIDITKEIYTNSDTLNFLYLKPLEADYTLSVNAKVSTVNMIDEIKMPVKFPVTNLDTSLYIYTKPTQIIDVNSDIKNLASELIGDKTDLYEIEYVFAEYVRKNIAYDLGTITSNADQKSSWVFANRVGVCDEITNLFISLNRAVGIPSRFVSGVSYTNLDSVFGTSWVSHAWAEIYYPGVGWVPYDVTYGQYGFIDAGHIKLSDSFDSTSLSVGYNYLGNNVKVIPGSFDVDVKVLDYAENAHARYTFDIASYVSNVGFGSYDLISVDVKNSMGYYQVADLYLAETTGMTIIEDSKETVLNKTLHRKQVLLKPYELKTIYWIIKIDDNLLSKYVYTLPILVYNTYNESEKTSIESKDTYPVIDYDYFKKIIDSKIDESKKAYSKNIHLECTANEDNIYLEDTAKISCILDNVGDKYFDEIIICTDNICSKRSLAVQKISLNYDKKFETTGLKNIPIKVYNDDITKASYVTINVLDKPQLSINELSYPATVFYGEPFDISFVLLKNSTSMPKNIRILLKSETTKVEWLFEELDSDKKFLVRQNGDSLRPNNNNYEMTIFYEDEKGNEYVFEDSFTLVSDANFFQKIFLYINLVFGSIENMFS
jgi:transglutaminase-like putative cysteine protease